MRTKEYDGGNFNVDVYGGKYGDFHTFATDDDGDLVFAGTCSGVWAEDLAFDFYHTDWYIGSFEAWADYEEYLSERNENWELYDYTWCLDHDAMDDGYCTHLANFATFESDGLEDHAISCAKPETALHDSGRKFIHAIHACAMEERRSNSDENKEE